MGEDVSKCPELTKEGLDQLKIRCFDWEISQMEKNYGEIAVKFICEVIPNEFFWIPASSSGKYHPACSRGNGGLVIHSKRVCYFIHQMTEGLKHPAVSKNAYDMQQSRLIFAAMVHDMAKKNKYDSNSPDYKNHPFIAAQMVVDNIELFKGIKDGNMECYRAADLIKTHMGVFTPNITTADFDKLLFDAKLLYMADYLSSRKHCGTFIDDFVVPEELISYVKSN
jgi:hypothetical protein